MRELMMEEISLVDGGGKGAEIVQMVAGVWATAVVGAAVGAVAGSIVPGAGNLAGAAAGAALGVGIGVGVILSSQK